MRERMQMVSLYSGVGGMDYGAHEAGIETVAMCEADAWNRSILNRHWPGVPVYESDEQVTSESLRERGVERIDIVAGGPPCQPFSVAGKKGGTADPRHRWPQMARIVDELRPAYVVVENVSGFSDVAEQLVRADLDSIGYRTVRFDIPAASVGAPHKRDRIFVVGYADERGRGVERLASEQADGSAVAQRADHEGATMAYTGRGSLQRLTERRDAPCTEGTRDGEGLQRERGRNDARDERAIAGSVADARNHGRIELGTAHDDNGNDAQRNEPRGRDPHGVGPVADSNSAGRGERRGAESVRAELAAVECGGGGRDPDMADASRELRQRDGSARHGSAEPSDRRGRIVESRLGGMSRWFADRLDAIRWPAPRGAAQYEWEPPRVTTEKNERRKRLKALGNICVPWQVFPIFAAIVAAEEAA